VKEATKETVAKLEAMGFPKELCEQVSTHPTHLIIYVTEKEEKSQRRLKKKLVLSSSHRQ